MVAFVALALVVRVAPHDAIDLAITDALQRLTPAGATFRAISWFGEGAIGAVAAAVVIAALFARGWRTEAVFAIASVVGSWLAYQLVKRAVDRPRPAPPVRVEQVVPGASFPSGHVMQYVALFGFVAVVVRARVQRPWLRRLLAIAAIALVAGVGPSRVYLGAHWPSDALGGYLLGGAWLVIVSGWYRAAARRSASRETRPDRRPRPA